MLIFFLLLSGAAYAVLGFAYKYAEKHQVRVPAFSLVMMLAAGGFSLGTVFTRPLSFGDPRIWFLGGLAGVLLLAAIWMITRANRIGPASIVWTFTTLGLLVPVLYFTVAMREAFSLVDLGSLLLFVLMLAAFAREIRGDRSVAAGKKWRYAALLCAIFLTNGGWLTISRMNEHLFQGTRSSEFAVINYGAALLLAAGWHLARHGRQLPGKNEWKAGLLAGLSSGVGTLALLAAMPLPAMVVFPSVNGLSLVGGVLLTVVVYREAVTRYKIVGVALGLAVMFLAIGRDSIAVLVSH